jgi:hypothetical protein
MKEHLKAPFPLSKAQLSLCHKRAQDLEIELWDAQFCLTPLDKQDKRILKLTKDVYAQDMRVLRAYGEWFKAQTPQMSA